MFENIPASLFDGLKQDAAFTNRYQLFTPETYRVTFMAVNARNPKLNNKYTRQVLAMLLDTEQIIRITTGNYATRTAAIVNPSDTAYYHPTLKPYAFDADQAKALLQKAGWQQQQGQWVMNSNSNLNDPLTLKLQLQYIAGSQVYENTGIILQQAANKIGIPIELVPVERRLLSRNLRNHEYELSFRSLSGSPFNFNYRQILHTSASVKGGSNFTGFGTTESDSIVNLLALNGADQHLQTRLYRLQEILHEEANFVFLYFSNNRIAIHQRFNNLKVSSIKPHYDVSAFKLKEK